MEAGKCRCAVDEFQASLAAKEHPSTHYMLARAYEECGEYEFAIKWYEQYLVSDPPDRFKVETYVRELKILAKHGCTKQEKISGACKPSMK